jgi:MarR family transcriptional regulator, lower aerobic nicotinate degradation pathway regulator
LFNYDVNRSLLRDIYQRPGFLLKRCHQVTAALFAHHCSKFSITPSQYGALAALRELPGIDQLALGRLIGLDRSTAGLVIKLLSERGLVQRSINDRDSRSMHLTLTPEGRRLLAEIEPAANRAQRAALDPLPAAKRSQFLVLLDMFLRRHGAVIDPASVMAGKVFGSRFDALHVAPPQDAKYSGTGRKVHSRSNRLKRREHR